MKCELCGSDRRRPLLVTLRRDSGELIDWACDLCLVERRWYCRRHDEPHRGLWVDGTHICPSCRKEEIFRCLNDGVNYLELIQPVLEHPAIKQYFVWGGRLAFAWASTEFNLERNSDRDLLKNYGIRRPIRSNAQIAEEVRNNYLPKNWLSRWGGARLEREEQTIRVLRFLVTSAHRFGLTVEGIMEEMSHHGSVSGLPVVLHYDALEYHFYFAVPE